MTTTLSVEVRVEHLRNPDMDGYYLLPSDEAIDRLETRMAATVHAYEFMPVCPDGTAWVRSEYVPVAQAPQVAKHLETQLRVAVLNAYPPAARKALGVQWVLDAQAAEAAVV